MNPTIAKKHNQDHGQREQAFITKVGPETASVSFFRLPCWVRPDFDTLWALLFPVVWERPDVVGRSPDRHHEGQADSAKL